MDTEELKKQAQTAYEEQNYSSAVDLFLKAAEIAEKNNLSLDSAELKNNASVAALMNNNASLAFQLAEHTEALFIQAGDKKRAGIALANQASALESLGKNSESFALFSEASRILKEADEKDLRSYILKRMSSLQIKQGKQFEALGSMNAALENASSLSGREKILKRLSNLVMKLIQR